MGVAVEFSHEKNTLDHREGDNHSSTLAIEHFDTLGLQEGSGDDEALYKAMVQPSDHYLLVSRFVALSHARRPAWEDWVP